MTEPIKIYDMTVVSTSTLWKSLKFIGFGEDTIKEVFDLISTIDHLPEGAHLIRISDIMPEHVGRRIRLFSRDADRRVEGQLTAAHTPSADKDYQAHLGYIIVIDGKFHEVHHWDPVVLYGKES